MWYIVCHGCRVRGHAGRGEGRRPAVDLEWYEGVKNLPALPKGHRAVEWGKDIPAAKGSVVDKKRTLNPGKFFGLSPEGLEGHAAQGLGGVLPRLGAVLREMNRNIVCIGAGCIGGPTMAERASQRSKGHHAPNPAHRVHGRR